MFRFRVLAAVLGCLAVLAGSLMTVAAAAPSAPARGAMEAPCTHCDECDGAPCPAPTMTCVQACVGVAPSLAVTTVSLPAPSVAGKAFRPARPAVLSGLSPPPDPFPPRA